MNRHFYVRVVVIEYLEAGAKVAKTDQAREVRLAGAEPTAEQVEETLQRAVLEAFRDCLKEKTEPAPREIDDDRKTPKVKFKPRDDG